MLALHQFCLVFESVGVFNFRVFFPFVYRSNRKKKRRKTEKYENVFKKKTSLFGLHLFDFRMCFSAALPRLFIFVYFRVCHCKSHTDGHTCRALLATYYTALRIVKVEKTLKFLWTQVKEVLLFILMWWSESLIHWRFLLRNHFSNTSSSLKCTEFSHLAKLMSCDVTFRCKK